MIKINGVHQCPTCGYVPTFIPTQYSDVAKRTKIECRCGSYQIWGGIWLAKIDWNATVKSEVRAIRKDKRNA